MSMPNTRKGHMKNDWPNHIVLREDGNDCVVRVENIREYDNVMYSED